MEVRALVEGQFLSRRLHAERLGYSISKVTSSSPQSQLETFKAVTWLSPASSCVCFQWQEPECWQQEELHPTKRSCRSVSVSTRVM